MGIIPLSLFYFYFRKKEKDRIMDNNKVFNVKNRSAGVVGYNIPEEKN